MLPAMLALSSYLHKGSARAHMDFRQFGLEAGASVPADGAVLRSSLLLMKKLFIALRH